MMTQIIYFPLERREVKRRSSRRSAGIRRTHRRTSRPQAGEFERPSMSGALCVPKSQDAAPHSTVKLARTALPAFWHRWRRHAYGCPVGSAIAEHWCLVWAINSEPTSWSLLGRGRAGPSNGEPVGQERAFRDQPMPLKARFSSRRLWRNQVQVGYWLRSY